MGPLYNRAYDQYTLIEHSPTNGTVAMYYIARKFGRKKFGEWVDQPMVVNCNY